MGDFNVAPDDKLLLPIREKMKDTAEMFDAPKLSWPSDKPEIKIDYIFVSPELKDAVDTYTVCPSKRDGQWISDHNAIIATITLPDAQ
jgi:endonuclease/exonuclease/phosphatase family metal-dependent hydrolase